MNKFKSNQGLKKYGKINDNLNINNIPKNDTLHEIEIIETKTENELPEISTNIELEQIYKKDEEVPNKDQINNVTINKDEKTKQFVNVVNKIIKDKKSKSGW
jgi:hypothetical protein